MDNRALDELTTRFLDAWNAQDVDRVVVSYTDDVRYRDPNTRGYVEGREALARYLRKLFARWTMTWAKRESFPLAATDGVAFLWRATFRRDGSSAIVEANGMDLVVLRGDRIARNEVYFDRAVLAPLVVPPAA